MLLGDKIRRLRRKMVLGQADFAKVLNIHTASVSHYETNNRLPLAHIMRRIIELAAQHNVDITAEDYLKRS